MTVRPACSVELARTPQDMRDVAMLFQEYANALGVDLYGLQGFQSELDSLPGKYSPPHGELFLSRDAHGKPLGCVAVKALPSKEESCELQRLFVQPSARGLGLGRKLLAAAIDRARAAGYKTMYLDSLPTLQSALAIYEDAGFSRVEKYWDTPWDGVLYFAKTL
ncbi:hypothetical protein QBZ16_001088 [Prototheca wickerhamii]|uniref:N-acetyltransferase domain-containing protein n=1 Tax=Prototheca wickerhamii TaxID=3111 RepID=A0AAD9MM02_PROWI|nr:hypothetical protein QBZ16_001088 [Prototheca wickerhamii]